MNEFKLRCDVSWEGSGATEEETSAVDPARLYQAAAVLTFPGIPKVDSQLEHLLEQGEDG